ncbi:unnamed protein product [Rotaria sordida]|uniref:Uncharacterized protein n=1 Tax=Rotaria sordida TaxID=392033 RepID=A0A819PQQ0_9BILA|nr:unnamed protein product [Rotaria sordida]CAF4021509.1 unnamed protein product [Rotaria sordida]
MQTIVNNWLAMKIKGIIWDDASYDYGVTRTRPNTMISYCHLLNLGSQSTPLDDYVRAQDFHFDWSLIQTCDEQEYKLYILNFISLKMIRCRPIWWYYLCVIVPPKLTWPNTGFMLMDQGSNTDQFE